MKRWPVDDFWRPNTPRPVSAGSLMVCFSKQPVDEREQVLDGLVEIAEKEFGGVVERPFLTIVYLCQRK